MRKKLRGFNLTELLVAMAIFSIVIALSVPSFNNWIARSRQHNLARALLETMIVVRTEAIKHNARVNACPSRDLKTCSGGSDWENGWIVFRAVNEDGKLEIDEEVELLYVVEGNFPGVSTKPNQHLKQYISYIGSGMSQQLRGSLLMGTIEVCTPGQSVVEVVMAHSGRPRIDRKKTPC